MPDYEEMDVIEGKTIFCLICARGGSKGIPGKNLRVIGGRPLIGWSIHTARLCTAIDRIVVSTDDRGIAVVAKNLGAEVPFLRPKELARDTSPEWPVWQHAIKELAALNGFQPDYLVVLPPTSPFRSHDDIDKSIRVLHEGAADIVISVTASGRNPYFNMVEFDPDGYARLSKMPEKRVTRRQDAPRVYDITTVLYTAKTDYVKNSGGIFDGKVKAVEIPDLRALDIDTELDLKFAEYLLAEGFMRVS